VGSILSGSEGMVRVKRISSQKRLNSQKGVSSIKNIESPDLHQFSLFSKAKQIRVLVREGESIFIFSCWWQTTKIITPSNSGTCQFY